MGYTGDDSGSIDRLNEIDSRCVVKFRPADDWEGEYGFDWFREGDYEERTMDGGPGLSHYKDVVGKYAAEIVYINRNGDEVKDLITEIFWKAYPNVVCDDSVHFLVPIRNTNNQYYAKNRNNDYIYEADNDGNVLIDGNGNQVKEIYTKTSDTEYTGSLGDKANLIYFTDYEGEKITIDPDWEAFLSSLSGVQPEFKDKIANIVYPNLLGDEYIDRGIHVSFGNNTQSSYYVPRISLFCKGMIEDSLLTVMTQSMYANSVKNNHFENFGKWQAKIKLIVEANTEVDQIEFFCDEGLSCEPSKISIKNGKPKKENVVISNESLAFPTKTEEAFITVKASCNGDEPTIAGKICVVKYPPKSVEVVFVPIFSRLNKGVALPLLINPILGMPVTMYKASQLIKEVIDLDKETKYLKQFFAQAQIVPSISIRRITNVESLRKIEKLIEAATDVVSKKVSTKTVNGNIKLEDGTPIAKGIKLHEELENLFNEEYNDLRDAYKVFFIPAEGNGRPGYLLRGETAGYPNDRPIPPKNVIIFKHPDSSTTSHELFHRFGIYHSFSNKHTHTYREGETSNIMDYRNKLTRISTWKWQWDEIRKFDGMKDIEIDDLNPYRVIV